MKGIVNIKSESMQKVAKDYKKFIESCTSFSLVFRENWQLNTSGKNFVNNLAPYLIITEIKSEWPGTILTNGRASVFYYQLNQDSLKILNQLDSLFDLEAPSFLEDICFYINKEPFLITISHEKDLYFQINMNDLPVLEKSLEKEEIEWEAWVPLSIDK